MAVLANPSSSSSVATRGAPDKVGRDVGELVRHRPDGRHRHRRRRRAARAEARLRRLQPEVARRRRARPHPRGRQSTSSRPPRSSPATRSATAASGSIDACERGQLDLRVGHEPGSREPARHRVGRAVRPHRLDHESLESVDSTGYDSPETELPGRLRVGRSTIPGCPDDGRRGHRGVRRRGAPRWPTRSASSSTTCGARRSSRRPPKTSTSARGDRRRLRRRRRGQLAGHARWPHGRSRSTSAGARARTLEPDWPIEHGYLVDVQGLPCVRTKLEIFPPPTSWRSRSRTTWCSGWS